MKSLDEVAAYLRADPFKYIVHLKMLEAYPHEIVWYARSSGGQSGVALLLPTAANPFDSRTYPEYRWVVLLTASGPAAAELLVRDLPRHDSLVFKLVDRLTTEVVLRAFPARRKTAYFSYTARAGQFPIDPAVVKADVLDERLLPSFQSNGYTRAELEQDFRQGSISLSVFNGDQPLSTCYIFQNYQRIWEIGGVYTNPAYRRQGLAKKVVSAALRNLLDGNRIPRYQVVETNLASIHLAENLGMERFLTTEHYVVSATSIEKIQNDET